MSNTSSNGEGFKAVDNQTNDGAFVDSPSGTCAQTLSMNDTLLWGPLDVGIGFGFRPQPGNWIRVDFGTWYSIAAVTVVGRSDCCPEESNNWTITIGNSGNLIGEIRDEICKKNVNAGKAVQLCFCLLRPPHCVVCSWWRRVTHRM